MVRSSVMVLLLAGTVPLAAQVTVTGLVHEDGSGRPLPGVQVVIEGTTRETTTDNAGRYRLDAPTGTRIALFRAIGFRPARVRLQLASGDSAISNVALVREQAQQLDPVETTASPSRPRGGGVEAFAERRSRGRGRFIDSTALRRYDGRRLGDVLRDVPGIRISEGRIVGEGLALTRGGQCFMSILLDGAPYYRSDSRFAAPDFRREPLLVESVQAIEVYRSVSEVPVELGGPTEQCGLLVLWTRRPQ